MDRAYRVFRDEQEYKRCLKYELKNEFLPQNITEFPAYVVYDYYFGQWCKVNFEDFIVYLEAMRLELQVQLDDIMQYLDRADDD